MEKESCIVGMVKAWAVVTLESLVNHAIAEALNNKVLAIMAIEYPSQITDKLRIGKSARSELAKKIIILSDSVEQNTKIISLADKLADTRNLIVHDKPFSVIDHGEGEFEIEYFRSRGEDSNEQFRYEDLQVFYEDCDSIRDYILTKTGPDSLEISSSFSSLFNS
ncbi:MAG: hypothetical protein EPN17_11160 [Methylobacter sp.]|nr:MAG: hypothetical protein EPN17_11160 [Methylobacter sp.]